MLAADELRAKAPNGAIGTYRWPSWSRRDSKPRVLLVERLLTVFDTGVPPEIPPAEGDLKPIMEIGEGAVAAPQYPPPDHGADLLNPNMDLIDLGHRFNSHDLGQRTQSRPGVQPPVCPGLLLNFGNAPCRNSRFRYD